MTEETKANSAVAGRFACYRVLELSPRYSDRAGASKVQDTSPSADGSHVEITLGDLPDTLLFGLSNGVPALKAQTTFMQPRAEHQHMDEPDIDEADLSIELPEFADPDVTYMTLAYVRPASVEALPERRIWWVKDVHGTVNRLLEFKSQANEALDRVCARLPVAATRIDHVVMPSDKAYFEPNSESHLPITNAAITMSATGHVVASGWDAVDLGSLTSVLDGLWKPTPQDEVIKTPSWLMYQAMDEPDTLKRFLLAHWGLESLALKFASQYRKQLTAHLISNAGLPADELFWPNPEGTDRPGRGIVFDFALMAWAIKGTDAPSDIAKFKSLAALRNKISHGSRVATATIPRHDGYRMLRDYLPLVHTYKPPA